MLGTEERNQTLQNGREQKKPQSQNEQGMFETVSVAYICWGSTKAGRFTCCYQSLEQPWEPRSFFPILEMRDLEINKVRHKKVKKPEQAHITAKW